LAVPLCDAHQLVGAAFEDLLRLELQRLNPTAKPGRCLATDAVEFAELTARKGGSVEVGTHLVQGLSLRGLATVYSQSPNPEKEVQKLRAALQRAENQSREYVCSGVITPALLTSCWMVAKIIGSFRGGRKGLADSVLIPYEFSSIDFKGLDDIAAMFALVNHESFRAQQRCLLRPKFRHNTLPGADQPDFVIDDMLIDVKCTARRSLDRRDVDQLLRYYALSKVEGLAGESNDREIDRLVIYYARFAQMFVIDIRRDFPPERVTKFLEWFEQQHHRLGKDEDEG
jgi:hypothetical protein